MSGQSEFLLDKLKNVPVARVLSLWYAANGSLVDIQNTCYMVATTPSTPEAQ